MSEHEVIGDMNGRSAEGIVNKFLDVCEGKRVIVITSQAPHDGKSTVVLSLADALSEYGKSVIVIDADLRAGSGIASRLGLVPHRYIDKEFMDYSYDTGRYKVVYPRVFGWKPESIITSDKFKNLVQFARQEYEIVLIDTPPYPRIPDAEMVAEMADGIVLVKSDTIVHNSKEIPVLGVINNHYFRRRPRGWRILKTQ